VAVPTEMVQLIVSEKNPGVLPVIHDLWENKPQQWESLYGDVGAPAEAALLRRFPTAQGPLLYSVVRLLGRVGTSSSLPMLESALPGANPELRVLLEKSMHSIRERAER
jgi:hypothetical protein